MKTAIPRYRLPDANEAVIWHGDCRALLRHVPAGVVDAVITDPPYPEIDRSYGRLSEHEWHELIAAVVAHVRRILKPSGSAVFILQANQERVGRTRPWLWEFMARMARDWNMIQDVWWFNTAALPSVHAHRDIGLMRPSVKACVWLGSSDCYRNQSAVLMAESAANAARRTAGRRALERRPSGWGMRPARCASAASERGGVTPFNLLAVSNTESTDSAGTHGHGAGTPLALVDWWVRYLTPPNGLICDPFIGSGTTALAAFARGHACIGIEQEPDYVATARGRLARALLPLFDRPAEEPEAGG